MSPSKGAGPKAALYALVCLFSGGVLSGCAELHELRECGPHGCATDRQITAAVHERLSAQRGLLEPITVQTYQGTVYLGGRVLTEAQKEAAGSTALATAGVLSLRNDLVVEEDSGS
ncbi:MAG: BON domain-containing protein [Proteobacteria bacterium]|nr:BON domain-containing protein [Pseudomonadota bacterium]